MKNEQFTQIFHKTNKLRQEDLSATSALQSKVVAKMIATANKETERIEHHLLEMPLSVIIYRWFIVRLKSQPWRLLIPMSMALSLLLQGILSRFNLYQLLFH